MTTRLRTAIALSSMGFLLPALAASAAFAGQGAAGEPRHSPPASKRPSPRRGWVFGIHVGSMPANTPSKIFTSQLPQPGPTFLTVNGDPSRYVPSWYFGDGAALANGVATFTGDPGRIVPLDPVLTTSSATRQAGTNLGFYVGHSIGRHVMLAFSYDRVAGRLALTDAARTAVAATNASFRPYWDVMLTRALTPNVSTSSTLSITDSVGGATLMSGVAQIRIVTIHGWSPYVALGFGFVLPSFTSPTVTLVGNYKLTIVNPGFGNNGAAFNETDQVQVRFEAFPTGTGIFGVGVERELNRHLGLRVDLRSFGKANLVRTRLDSRPVSVADTPPFAVLRRGVTPSLQISTLLTTQPTSLSLQGVDHFESFRGAGDLASFSVGLFFRF